MDEEENDKVQLELLRGCVILYIQYFNLKEGFGETNEGFNRNY